MTHHVARIKKCKADALDVLEHFGHLDQTRRRAARQIDLRHIAGHHCRGIKTQARQKHFHLLNGGVLRFVENDECIVQGAPAHIRQRGHFNDIAFDQLGHVLEAEQLVECVVQRPQIGVNFLRQIAGQKSQPLTRFHRRAHQHKPLHLVALQRVDRADHGQIGFPGASRADAEVDIVRADVIQVAALRRTTPRHQPVFGVYDDRLIRCGVIRFVHTRLLQVQMHHVGRELLGRGLVIKITEDIRRNAHRLARPADT